MIRIVCAAGLAATLALGPATAAAQEAADGATRPAYGNTVFDGDWISLGVGGAWSPSYDGSDDYKASVLPIVQGSLAGVGINPRPGGLALDFLPDGDGPVAFNLGVAGRVNSNRNGRIKDDVVELYGEKKTAIEVGPSIGVKFPGLLNPYDSLSLNLDALWDIAGAHKGRVIQPSVTYFTPLSRGTAASLSLAARHVDDKYAAYYFSVPVIPDVPAGSALPPFAAKGGFDKLSVGAFGAIDLDGDATNGGLSVIAIGSYSRLLGDAKRSPFTSIRGSADQWMLGAGVGYTF